jgi:hypothetical protein
MWKYPYVRSSSDKDTILTEWYAVLSDEHILFHAIFHPTIRTLLQLASETIVTTDWRRRIILIDLHAHSSQWVIYAK